MGVVHLLGLVAIVTAPLGPGCGGSTESSPQAGGGGSTGGGDAQPDRSSDHAVPGVGVRDPCCNPGLPPLSCKLHDCEKAERTYFDCGLGKWSVGATASDVPCSDGGS